MTQSKHTDTPTVFIIEDDFRLGTMLQEILSRHYRTHLSTDGREAMTILAENTIDLLLLDIMLPETHGFTLLKEIRAMYAPEDLPIIIISARDDAETIVSGFEAGANDYIVKPMKNSVILARIETQLKLSRLQHEHKQYIATLERSDSLRRQLSQIASHDLKNPLHNLRLVENLLGEELGNHPRVQPLLKTMTASLDMMEDLVGAFVDVVEIQSDMVTLNTIELDMRTVIMNVLTQYELTAQRKNIKMVVKETEGTVFADEARMTQIVGNLVSNALKYSPRDSHIEIGSYVSDGWVCLQVIDFGMGIPENERRLLFDEFADISTRPTDGENSTGLGLWIVRRLIELQGGHAGADFPDEGGSIFWIKLPAIE